MAIRVSTGDRNAQLEARRTAYAKGVLCLFSGSQPTSSDDAESGTLLCRITVDGGDYTDLSTNGLSFDAASGGSMTKAAAETWSGTGLADGVAGWYRFYDTNYTTGASTTAKRWDGSVGTSGADLNLANTSITNGGPVSITEFTCSEPAA